MKNIKILVLTLFASFTTLAAQAPQSEQDAIRAMQGCYAVQFHFVETFVTEPAYPVRSKEYLEYALEWVELDQDSGDEIALQHVLVTPDGVQKHWRQEWSYQPSKLLEFQGNSTWKTNFLEAVATQGMWAQRVYQVDDSPRYECAAPWVQYTSPKGEKKSYWECEANAPLPRREFSQRSDYQILKRRNRHEIVAKGWTHEQDNSKMKFANATDIQSLLSEIAREKGEDTYTKVDDARCASAKQYWSKNKEIWHAIQDMWKHIQGHHPQFTLKGKLNGQTLWMALFNLADRAATTAMNTSQVKEQAHDLIHEYME